MMQPLKLLFHKLIPNFQTMKSKGETRWKFLIFRQEAMTLLHLFLQIAPIR